MDRFHVVADGEHALPPGDGVRADDGVHGFEDLADVFGGAAGPGEDLEVVAGGGFVEGWLRVVCC